MKTSWWTRSAVIFAVVTIAISQIAFNLVLRNVRGTPSHWLFFFWTILWFQIIPFVILICVDRLLSSNGVETNTARLWRALLYAFLFVLFVRQLQMSNMEVFHRATWFVPPWLLYPGLALIIFIISIKFARAFQTYISYLTFGAAILTLMFLWRCFQSGFSEDPSQNVNFRKDDKLHPILFLVFDELSLQRIMKDGEINRELFPNFASLASDSVWFQNAMTNHFETAEALPTILTGRVTPAVGSSNIFDLLGTQYRINVMETDMGFESDVCRDRKWKGECRSAGTFVAKDPIYSFKFIRDVAYGYFLEGGLEKHVLFTPQYHMTLKDELEFVLQNINTNQNAQMIYWHISIPHSPFIFSNDGRLVDRAPTYFPLPGTPLRVNFDQAVAKYIEQVRFSDMVLGKILNRLKSQGVYKDTVIFMMSDHGLRVWNDLYNHVNETARVPVFLHAPGLTPSKSTIDFQLMDVVPTLLDVIGRPIKSTDFDGISALSNPSEQRKRIFHFYLQDYAWNDSQNSWEAISKKESNSDKKLSFGMKVERSFSATQVENDLGSSRERHVDFLTAYLATHFPVTINTEQMDSLQKNLAAIPNFPSNSLSYKKGMHYFFLALGGTSRILDNHSDDAKTVDHWWHESLKCFQTSKDLGLRMTKELDEIISGADVNKNGSLERAELATIITSRLKEVE
jgi:sulfatase-like protein